MSASPKFHRCGACNTKNAHVRSKAVPYGQEGWLLIRFLSCRRCDAGRPLRDGIDPWRGERVEAAMLRPEHRPGSDAERRDTERLSMMLSDTSEGRAERDRVRAALRPYPIPTGPALRVVK